jgi:hypothetical protein
MFKMSLMLVCALYGGRVCILLVFISNFRVVFKKTGKLLALYRATELISKTFGWRVLFGGFRSGIIVTRLPPAAGYLENTKCQHPSWSEGVTSHIDI